MIFLFRKLLYDCIHPSYKNKNKTKKQKKTPCYNLEEPKGA